MIKISTPTHKRSAWIVWAVTGSFFVHGALFWGGTRYANHKEKNSYEVSRIEFTAPPISEPEPEPKTAQQTEPESELAPEPEPVPKPEPVAAQPQPPKAKPKSRPPKPNTSKTPPPQAEPPKPVFGATAGSVGNGDSSVAIRVGNTLETVMEKKAPPKKVAPLAPVVDKSLPVSVKAQEKAPVKKVLKPVPVYNLSKAPKFKTRVAPVYPQEARKAEVEGVVQLEVLIDTEGRVRHVKVLKTPGAGLEKAAVAALSKSRFDPGMVNGKPVPVKIKIPYRFILDS